MRLAFELFFAVVIIANVSWLYVAGLFGYSTRILLTLVLVLVYSY